MSAWLTMGICILLEERQFQQFTLLPLNLMELLELGQHSLPYLKHCMLMVVLSITGICLSLVGITQLPNLLFIQPRLMVMEPLALGPRFQPYLLFDKTYQLLLIMDICMLQGDQLMELQVPQQFTLPRLMLMEPLALGEHCLLCRKYYLDMLLLFTTVIYLYLEDIVRSPPSTQPLFNPLLLLSMLRGHCQL